MFDARSMVMLALGRDRRELRSFFDSDVGLSTASQHNSRARSRMNAPNGLGSMHESYVRVEPTWDKT